MRNYVTIVFGSSAAAFEGQQELWELDAEARITVHGTVVVHRDNLGQLIVDTDDTMPPGVATAMGAGIGALLGSFAGPLGTALGIAGASAIGAGAGAAVGLGVGGTGGLVAEVAHEDLKDQAAFETSFVLGKGQHAVIADVSEEWTGPIDERMGELGATVFRRARASVREDAVNFPYSWDSYLYPYEYKAPVYA